jgi:hypothetical protein
MSHASFADAIRAHQTICPQRYRHLIAVESSLSSLREEIERVAVWWERDMCAGTGDLYGVAARLRALLKGDHDA